MTHLALPPVLPKQADWVTLPLWGEPSTHANETRVEKQEWQEWPFYTKVILPPCKQAHKRNVIKISYTNSPRFAFIEIYLACFQTLEIKCWVPTETRTSAIRQPVRLEQTTLVWQEHARNNGFKSWCLIKRALSQINHCISCVLRTYYYVGCLKSCNWRFSWMASRESRVIASMIPGKCVSWSMFKFCTF